MGLVDFLPAGLSMGLVDFLSAGRGGDTTGACSGLGASSGRDFTGRRRGDTFCACRASGNTLSGCRRASEASRARASCSCRAGDAFCARFCDALAFGGLGILSDLFFDARSRVRESFDVASGFVNCEDETERIRTVVEFVGAFEGLDGGFSLTETFAGLREGDIARRNGVFEFDCLFESHGCLFISAGFEVN